MKPESLRSNLHCHSVFSDGQDSLEDMVRAAVQRGFVSLGVSEHAYTPYDSECCMKQDHIPAYFAEMARLKEKYDGVLELYTGLEIDSHHHTPKEGLDFTIGSVHYLHDQQLGRYYNVDHTPEMLQLARDRVAGGDVREMVGNYYRQVVELAETDRPDIIGHLDLIKKLNADHRFFDETSSWYLDQVEAAAKAVAATGCIVEVNTGAIFRGYREDPYPSRDVLAMFFHLGVPVILSSDAHCAQALDFWFAEARALLLDIGYRSVKQLRGGRFIDVEL